MFFKWFKKASVESVEDTYIKQEILTQFKNPHQVIFGGVYAEVPTNMYLPNVVSALMKKGYSVTQLGIGSRKLYIK